MWHTIQGALATLRAAEWVPTTAVRVLIGIFFCISGGTIGWLYLFGGRAGARQVVATSVIDRLVFVPAVLIPLAIGGVFPHLLVTLAILDPLLAVGAWVLLSRKT